MPYGADPTVGAAGYGRDPEQAAGKPKPQPKQDSGSTMGALFHSFLYGAEATVGGAMQFADRAIPAAPAGFGGAGQDRMRAEIEREVQQSERDYKASPETSAHPIASGIGHLAGEVAPTLMIPGGGAARLATGVARGLPSAAGMIGRGAALGAAGGAMQPVAPPQGQPASQPTSQGDYWGQKLKDLAVGAGLGAALPGVGSALSPRLPNPQVVASGIARAFRPLANFISGAEERTVNGFDRTIARQVLEPIGGDVPRTLSGHNLVEHTENAIGDVYNRVLPNVTLPRQLALGPNPGLAQTISELGADEAKQFSTILANRLISKFPPTGMMPGPLFQRARSDLSGRARSFLGTNKDELGHALLETVAHLDDVVAQANPQFAPELAKANAAWRMFVRMRQAASGATGEGKFTPADMLRATRRQERTASAFAKGDAPLQGYAEAANRAMNGERNPMALLHIFSRHGLPVELARQLVGPAGRAAKAVSPGVAAPLGREQERVPGVTRAKAAKRVSEIQNERYLANRKGDTPKVAELGQKLAEAQAEYKKLVPQAA